MTDFIKDRLNAKVETSRGLKAGSTMLAFSRGFTNPLLDVEETPTGGRIYTTFPTHIPSIDYFLPLGENGKKGFPAGHLHMITGEQETLKSAVTGRMEIAACNAGAIVYHIETDGHWNRETFLNGVLGHFKDEEAKLRFNYIECGTLDDLYQIITAIMTHHKEVLSNKARTEKKAVSDYYYARDVQPILIVIDTISGVISENSLEKENKEGLGSTQVGEGPKEIRRLVDSLNGMVLSLGACIVMTNHWRANIGVMYGEKNKPFLWYALGQRMNVALDFSAVFEQKVTTRGEDYRPVKLLRVRARKLKNQELHKQLSLLETRFHRRYGFDFQKAMFDVLTYCGYCEVSNKSIKILAQNGAKIDIPEAMREFVGEHDTKEFLKKLREDIDYKRRFFEAYMAAESTMMPSWIDDRREVNWDDIIFGVDLDGTPTEVEVVKPASAKGRAAKKTAAKEENAKIRAKAKPKILTMAEADASVAPGKLIDDHDESAPGNIMDIEPDDEAMEFE